tara:strand:+ start:273 stop:710 length:438 start_codon:yes stop_codon:yes gene_type:complete
MAREGLNKVTLIGNLGADPELKHTQGGQAVLKMRLATTETFKQRDGQRGESTQWHSVVLWGNRAEALAKFLEKGRTICVEGSIEYRQWEDNDGNKRNATEIKARNVILLGGGGGEKRGGFGGGSKPSGGFNEYPADDFGDDEIPF